MASYKGFLTIAKVADGSPGESGSTLYTWVVYSKGSKQPTLNEDMTFTPTKETVWMGMLTNQKTPPPSAIPPSLLPSSIIWTEIKGENGAAALTMVITSTNGTIFKNKDIATTLTAHVYKGGTEVIGSELTALGTIKWYKDGSTTSVATGATLTIKPGEVSNQANYIAQLE